MNPHCNSCSCFPKTVCGIDRKALLFACRCMGVGSMITAGILVMHYSTKYGLTEWGLYRYYIFNFLVIFSIGSFTVVGILCALPFSDDIWGIICGIWYVTAGFFTDIPWRNLVNCIIRRGAVGPSPEANADDSSSSSSGEPPPLPPKQNVLRGLEPVPQQSLELGPHSASPTTQSDPTQAGAEQSSSSDIEASPQPQPVTKPLNKKQKFRRKMNAIIKMKPIEEIEEDYFNLDLSHIEIPLSHLLSRSESSNQTVQEETSFTISEQVEGQIRSSMDEESKDSSQKTELTSAEVYLPQSKAFYQPRTFEVDIHRPQTLSETCISFEGAMQLAETSAAEDIPKDPKDGKEISSYVRFSAKFQPIQTQPISIQRQQIRNERIQESFPLAGEITQGKISETEDIEKGQKGSEQTLKSIYVPYLEMERQSSSQRHIPASVSGQISDRYVSHSAMGQMSQEHVPPSLAGGQSSQRHAQSVSGQSSQEQMPSTAAGQTSDAYVPYSVMEQMSLRPVPPSAVGGQSSQRYVPSAISVQSSQEQMPSLVAGQTSDAYVAYSVMKQMSQGPVPPSVAGGQSSQGHVPSVSGKSSREQMPSTVAGQTSDAYVPYSVMKQISQGPVPLSAAEGQSSQTHVPLAVSGQSSQEQMPSVAGQTSDTYVPYSVMKRMSQGPVPPSVAGGQSSQGHVPSVSGQSSQEQMPSVAGQTSDAYVAYSVMKQMSQGSVLPSVAGGQSSQGNVPSVSGQSSQEQMPSSVAGQTSDAYVAYSVMKQMSQGPVQPSVSRQSSEGQVEPSVAEGQSPGHAQSSVAGQTSDMYVSHSVMKKMLKEHVPSSIAEGQSSQLYFQLTAQGHAQLSREQSSQGHAQVSRVDLSSQGHMHVSRDLKLSSQEYAHASGAVEPSAVRGQESLSTAERQKKTEVKGAIMKQKKYEQTSVRAFLPQSQLGKQATYSQSPVIVEQPRSEQKISKELYVQLPDLASKRSASKERGTSEMKIRTKSSMDRKDENQQSHSSDDDSSQPLLQKPRGRDDGNLQSHSSKGVFRSPLRGAVGRQTAAMERLPNLHVSRGFSVPCEEGEEPEQLRSFYDQPPMVLDLTHIDVPIHTKKDKEDK